MSENIRELIYTDISGPDMTEKDIKALTSALPEYFRIRVEGSKQRDQKMQRLSSGLLLMYLLRQYDIKATDVRIKTGIHGKPGFEDMDGLYFNLSHSGDLILMALTDTETGCDIQKIKKGSVRLAGRFFTPEENEMIESAKDGDIDEVFTRIWARKESYIKALGEGLGHDLRSFSVLSDVMSDGVCIADYSVNGYAAALALSPDKEGKIQSESFPDLRFMPFQNLVNVL